MILHWRAKPIGPWSELCGWLREEKRIGLSYRTLVRYLHEHRMRPQDSTPRAGASGS